MACCAALCCAVAARVARSSGDRCSSCASCCVGAWADVRMRLCLTVVCVYIRQQGARGLVLVCLVCGSGRACGTPCLADLFCGQGFLYQRGMLAVLWGFECSSPCSLLPPAARLYWALAYFNTEKRAYVRIAAFLTWLEVTALSLAALLASLLRAPAVSISWGCAPCCVVAGRAAVVAPVSTHVRQPERRVRGVAVRRACD